MSLSKIIDLEMRPGGQLARFKVLFTVNTIIDMSEFGVPQKRKRMIAGNFPLSLLKSYKTKLTPITMGEVLNALYEENPHDIVYGKILSSEQLTDNETEEFLSKEELRLNSDSKLRHHIYNKMAFPDPLHKPVRTITATCTRVSRESVIIEDTKYPNAFRRLTVRERGLLQGFPITYQFYGDTHSEKIKMIGNAVPPIFTYYLAHAMKNTNIENLPLLKEVGNQLSIPKELPKVTRPDSKGAKFSKTRKFCAVIPTLRFGSGVRFDLSNSFDSSKAVLWKISFYYGNSKKIQKIELNKKLSEQIKTTDIFNTINDDVKKFNDSLDSFLDGLTHEKLQNIWIHAEQGINTYDIIDFLDYQAQILLAKLNSIEDELVQSFVMTITNGHNKKLMDNAKEIFVGLIIGTEFNLNGLRKY